MKAELRNYVGVGLLLTFVFNLVLFALALILGFEDTGTGPTLFASCLLSVVMGAVVLTVIKMLKPLSLWRAICYSTSWSAIVLALTLVTTIANGTTAIFFRSHLAIAFVAMACSPVVLFRDLGGRQQRV